MVMQRRHEKYSPAFTVFFLCVLKVRYLYNDGEIFYEEDPAENRDEQLLAHSKREYRDHRLEWMLKHGGLPIVLDGIEKRTIQFSGAARVALAVAADPA